MKYNNYRINDINNNLSTIGINPIDVMVTGVTGAGKSTTLNTLFSKTIAKVGDGVDPETMELDSYKLNDSFRIWDTPGLGDGAKQDKVHSKKIIGLLYKDYYNNSHQYGFIDVVLVVLDGGTRDMGTTYKLLNEVIVPNFQKKRVLIAINQADMAMKGRNWDYNTNKPNQKLIDFLDEKAISIQKRVKEATNIDIIKPIYYSAKYDYNVDKLFDLIIDNMPKEKRDLKI
jgi:predicted GTPase